MVPGAGRCLLHGSCGVVRVTVFASTASSRCCRYFRPGKGVAAPKLVFLVLECLVCSPKAVTEGIWGGGVRAPVHIAKRSLASLAESFPADFVPNPLQ